MKSPPLVIMEPLLRLLQLFCENHNSEMQVSYMYSVLYYNSIFRTMPVILFIELRYNYIIVNNSIFRTMPVILFIELRYIIIYYCL